MSSASWASGDKLSVIPISPTAVVRSNMGVRGGADGLDEEVEDRGDVRGDRESEVAIVGAVMLMFQKCAERFVSSDRTVNTFRSLVGTLSDLSPTLP